MRAGNAGYLAELNRAMRPIAEAIDQLPMECRNASANALLNVAVAAVVEDAGCAEASRIFSRLSDLVGQGRQPPISGALSLADFDA